LSASHYRQPDERTCSSSRRYASSPERFNTISLSARKGTTLEINNLEQIDRRYRHIYFSPHLDDAALSCGGSIGLQTACGLKALVITAFAGLPPEDQQPGGFVSEIHLKAGLPASPHEAIKARRREDAEAISTLGADVFWLDHLDAIYRGNP